MLQILSAAKINAKGIRIPPLSFLTLSRLQDPTRKHCQPDDKYSLFNPVQTESLRPFCLVDLSFSDIKTWEEYNMAYASPGTDTSTDPDTDEKNQMFELGLLAARGASDIGDKSKDELGEKALRRLAQNREAARKSRLKKKAYVEQLENSRLKLAQLEQELQRARKQGIYISTSEDQPLSTGENGALGFESEYALWLEEQNKLTNELRDAVNGHARDDDLRRIVDNIMAHYSEAFRLNGVAARADAVRVLSGMWKTPVERCFLWLGGFRSSGLLKLLASHLEPLTDQQLASICNLQQSSEEAEKALSQGVETLQQSVAETLASGFLCPASSSSSSGNVADRNCQMAVAIGKLGTLENYLQEADNLRLQSLQQMQRILTTRQSARALLAITDYFSCLRALSSLWVARPRE
ncbi:hypothetical protein ACP4OV_028962 [Aristida adscensionis]